MIKKINIIKYNNSERENISDIVVLEVPLVLYVNNEEFLAVTASPDMEKELAVGILFNEEIITSYADILEIEYDKCKGDIKIQTKNEVDLKKTTGKRRYVSSGCAAERVAVPFKKLQKLRNKITSTEKFNIEDCYSLMTEVLQKAEVFKETGGVHTAGLGIDGKLLKVCEDIARHNTLSKLIGYALINNLDLTKSVIVSTGRISSEMVMKAVKSSIPLLVSRSAPTHSAVEIGLILGITLIGFLRGHRCNVYSNYQRLDTVETF